jgi:hypothetical protein
MITRKAVALLCIGLVLFAAFTAGTAAHVGDIVLEAVWIGFVPSAPTFTPPKVVRVFEQTSALIAARFSRPPPDLA